MPPETDQEDARPGPPRPWLGATLDLLRPAYDGPPSWLGVVGVARVGVIVFVAVGTQIAAAPIEFNWILLAIYAGALISSVWYLISLRTGAPVSATLTWTQVLVDFGVVAVTIAFTGGRGSVFTVLLVPVILEAGVLMGLAQAFVFATLATAFMFVRFLTPASEAPDPLAHWYDFLIQGIAFFFTAFISGYWNQRLNRMKQFQRDVLDNMNSGFLITDAKGLVIALNKAACKILGLEEGSVAGRHVDGVMRPDTGAECPVTTALRLNKDFTSYEFHADTGGPEPVLLGLTTNRIHGASGAVTGLIASFTDLTEMARMRQEMQRHDRMAAIGELTAGLAHEIRNPVAAIRSAMDELRRGDDNPKMRKRLAEIAVRESDHLNKIVTGFLDFARNPERTREPVDLAAVLRETAQQLERQHADGHSLRIALNLPEAPCWSLGDATQIRQVFINLGQNAIEAMDGRGTLDIVVTPPHAGHGPIEVRFDDNGPGIPPDKVARIFEPFYTEKDQGVGMGLAICMRIITAHDGAIQVAARPAGGASMRVRLPAAEPRASA